MLSCPGSPAEDKRPDQKPLAEALKNVIKDLSGKARLGEEEIAEAWNASVGADAARHSRPVSLNKGTIAVNVDSSGWLYELTVKKKDILKQLEAALKGKKIIDIRLRIGEVK